VLTETDNNRNGHSTRHRNGRRAKRAPIMTRREIRASLIVILAALERETARDRAATARYRARRRVARERFWDELLGWDEGTAP
jgi:hypothetical protein